MADRILKPDSGNDLVLQNDDGSGKIEINENASIPVTGTLDVSGATLTTSSAQKTAIVDGGKGNLTKSDVGLGNVTNDAQVPASGGTFSGNVAVTGDLSVDTDTLKVDSTNERVGINKTPATEFHAGGVIQLEDKVFAGGHTRTGSLVNINMGDDSTYAGSSAMLQIQNLGNRGAKGHASGSDLLRGDFSDANGFIFDKSGNLDITGSYNSGTIGNNVVFPAGTILQIAQAQDSQAFAYSNTSEWDFGSSSTRADDSHGGVADNLNVTLTTKKANSNFLVCVNLQNAGGSAAGNVWGLNCYWSVDSYANPIVAGDPSTHGVYSLGEGLQSGFWVDANNDATWYPHYSQILKSSNTIAKDTSITFKTVISSYYSITLYYNRQNTTNNGTYRLVPVSTLTIYEIAT